jgi:hypothetical protein
MDWPRIIGVVVVLYAGFVIYRGRLTSGDDYGNTSVVSRAEKPVQFWLTVLGMLVLAALLLLHVIKF